MTGTLFCSTNDPLLIHFLFPFVYLLRKQTWSLCLSKFEICKFWSFYTLFQYFFKLWGTLLTVIENIPIGIYQCSLHTANGTLHTSHRTLDTAHCTGQCTLHTAHCTLHTRHCPLNIAHYRLQIQSVDCSLYTCYIISSELLTNCHQGRLSRKLVLHHPRVLSPAHKSPQPWRWCSSAGIINS